MKFLGYINEKADFDVIRKECADYIKVSSYCGDKLYRGIAQKFNTMRKFKPRTNRLPRDTSWYTSKKFDEKFFKKFGWKPRAEGVFVTADVNAASSYGEEAGGGPAYIFYPVDGFKFSWSPKVPDFFTMVRNLYPGADKAGVDLIPSSIDFFYAEAVSILSMIDKKNLIDKVKKTLNTDVISEILADAIMSTYTDEHLCHAINYKVEVAFKCSAYYLVNQGWEY